ncbi:MAG: hypothetical protein L0H70_10565 [Xanthomonadales bacterium]|nr:hypothetical protein [Xanthomonadales bacterium]
MLWIVGTSVSIEANGYASRLAQRLHAEYNIDSRNLSVGDQTSLMGYMRVLMHRHEIGSGDVVVWEYSLLDSLLADSNVPADDIESARHQAWDVLVELGAHIIVLMVPAKAYLSHQSEQEQRMAADASALGLTCIDVRELFQTLDNSPAQHYRDDRHPSIASPIIGLMVERLTQAVVSVHGQALQQSPHRRWPDANWQWIGSAELARKSGLGRKRFSNSLVNLSAVSLHEGDRLPIAATSRVVAIGLLSTHASGGVWCGHPGCAPAATRLPAELAFPFLLRCSGLPCVRAQLDSIACAPDWAYGRGLWAAYGQALCAQPGQVWVFGVLYAPTTALISPTRHALLPLRNWLRRGRALWAKLGSFGAQPKRQL